MTTPISGNLFTFTPTPNKEVPLLDLNETVGQNRSNSMNSLSDPSSLGSIAGKRHYSHGSESESDEFSRSAKSTTILAHLNFTRRMNLASAALSNQLRLEESNAPAAHPQLKQVFGFEANKQQPK